MTTPDLPAQTYAASGASTFAKTSTVSKTFFTIDSTTDFKTFCC